jgi:hypothetical protein
VVRRRRRWRRLGMGSLTRGIGSELLLFGFPLGSFCKYSLQNALQGWAGWRRVFSVSAAAGLDLPTRVCCYQAPDRAGVAICVLLWLWGVFNMDGWWTGVKRRFGEMDGRWEVAKMHTSLIPSIIHLKSCGVIPLSGLSGWE